MRKNLLKKATVLTFALAMLLSMFAVTALAYDIDSDNVIEDVEAKVYSVMDEELTENHREIYETTNN